MYLRRRNSNGVWRVILTLILGSILTWWLVALYAKPIIIDITKIKQAFRFAGQPVFNSENQPFSQISAQVPASRIGQPTYSQEPVQVLISWDQEVTQVNIKKVQRQTVFNDQNYTPKTAINTIQPPPKRFFSSAELPISKQQFRRATHEGNWIWESADHKKARHGLFHWTEINGRVDLSSVCKGDYKYGSIEYRDCRKGAKVYLARLCKSYSAACGAGSLTP
ncbi:hypothetical protein [Pseudomonas mangiferae]|uniref:Uncharacterized protein n=1 Tax=Pseudomonas mangiferae TaxID=2593654 RepID=A0A553H1N4_9PSED|nr:hypothetical protein [Pseudomonas mangiferae]TRX75656.1 hypothetical protein FM069_07910 [Pseudomonas mangiferae]